MCGSWLISAQDWVQLALSCLAAVWLAPHGEEAAVLTSQLLQPSFRDVCIIISPPQKQRDMEECLMSHMLTGSWEMQILSKAMFLVGAASEGTLHTIQSRGL